MNLKERMKNYKVKKKLDRYGASIIIVILVLGATSIMANIAMNYQLEQITKNWMPTLTYAMQLDTLTSDYRLRQYAHLTALTDEKKEMYETMLAQADELITQTSVEMESYFVYDEE